ncbi:MAG: M56 family metallopeptidase [Akkermansiaceae bacterium]
MISTIAFSLIACGLVLLAGRKDPARDPRLTFFFLILMTLLPGMSLFLPKLEILPSTTSSQTSYSWGTWLIGVWALGFLSSLVKLTLSSISINRWRKLSPKIGQIGEVNVYEVEGLRGPVAAGTFRQMIFVPKNWKTWKQEAQKIAIDHELSHHRRRDPLWRLCAEITRAIHWYNPLVHWMVNRFALQCEYACDEALIRKGTDAKSYATLLCELAEKQASSPLTLAMATPSSLRQRVRRILEPNSRTGTLAFALLATLGATAACTLSMLGSESAPVSQQEVKLRLSANPFPSEN